MSIAIHDTFTKSTHIRNFNFKRFWTKSLGCGILGKQLARLTRYKVPEEAFIAGFIHDIGKVVMSQVFRSEYPRIEKLISAGEDELSTERDLAGTDHCVLGAWLGQKWKLPKQLLAPIQHHHRTERASTKIPGQQLVDIVYIAQKIFERIRNGSTTLEESDQLFDEADTLLGVPESVIIKIAKHAWPSITDVSIELGMQIETSPGSEYKEPVMPVSDDATVRSESRQQPGSPPPEDMMLEVQQISNQLSSRERELGILREASECIRHAETADEILQTLIESIYRGLDIGRIVVFDIDSGKMSAAGRIGFGVQSQEHVRQTEINLSAESGFLRAVVDRGETLNILDSESSIYETQRNEHELRIIDCRAFAILPVQIDGVVSMVILLNNKDHSIPIDDARLNSIQTLLNQAEIALENAHLKEKLRELRGKEVETLIDTAFSDNT